MRRFRGTLLCLVGSIGLVATACIPPTEPTNQAPIAVVAATPESGDAPLQVTFSPDGSSDADGAIVSYEWDFGDGSLPETLSTPDDVSHVYGFEGVYTATLTLTDNGGATGSTTVQISVGAPNSPPTAVIAADPTSGKEPLTVQFTGSGSSDADGTVESYEWDFGDGSATSSDADPSHLYDAAGLYTAQLTVTDDDGATGTETVNITVDANQPPTAVAAADPTQGKFPLTVQFTGSGSSDVDGTIESYEWDFGDGSATSDEADPSHLYTTPGAYTATLTVTDDNGQSTSDTVDITVDPNLPPTAVANANPTSGQEPLTVNFSSSASSDVDGTIVSRAWDFGDGNGSTAADPTYTYSVAGSYTAVLTVTDDNGDTDTAEVTIEVSPIPNEAPTAVAAGSPLSGKEPLTVGFSSAGSTDPEGGPLTYAWDFGDGGSSTQANPSHTFTAAGTYVVTLTVKDTANATGSTTVSIEVVANQAPEAFADASPFTVKEGGSIQFFSAGSNDPDGTLVSYLWDFGDGETSSAANPSHVYDAPGTFQVSLTVTDDNGVSTTDQDGIVITVTENQAPVAALNATPQNGARPLVVAFSSASSADPDGTIVSRSWDFGDGGPTSSAANPSYTYTQAGTFTATLTVTDDNGETDTDEVEIVVVVDDDGDGVSPPADCDDGAPATYPGAPDTLGDNVDSNCDGGDGVVAEIVHVRSGGGNDTTTCGSIGDPCATITFGLNRAQTTGRESVVVAGGSYDRFRVVNGIDVRGGFGQNFLRGTAATGSPLTVVNGSYDASYGASAGVIATGINSPTLVSDLRVVGANESANARASYGVIIANSTSALTMDTLTVVGGVGGAGSPGASGSSAPQSAAPGGGNGENGDDPVTACSTARKSGGGGASGAGSGGQGGSQDSNCGIFSLNYNATNGIGGSNAAVTGPGCGGAGGGGQANTTSAARDGGNGQTGCVSDGSGGSSGLATNGTLSGGLWVRTGGTGGTGTLGGNGGGGGGGGGGGANDDGINADDRGGGGGGGGQGGSRATAAGFGGSAGYASIAVLITSSQPNLPDLNVVLGTGGTGGPGGAGGLGQPGGPGGSGGARIDVGGRGGDGGDGGRGGHSGGGGGGAGGPSYGIATSNAMPTINASISGGAGGPGGSGGGTGVGGGPGQTGARLDSINF